MEDHRWCPLGWQKMGDDDFAIPSVFSEDVTMKIVSSL